MKRAKHHKAGIVAAVVVLTGLVAAPQASQAESSRRSGTPVVAVGVPAVGRPAEAGLRFEHHMTFELDPGAQVVRARHEITVENTQPDVVTGYYIRQSYFPSIGVPVVAQAANLAATRSDGTPLAVTLEPIVAPYVSVAVVDLQPDLYFGQTQSYLLTYDLPAVPPRSEAFLRVNNAFVTFPLLVDGDPGATTVEVRLPKSFTAEVVGDAMEESTDGDTTVLRATPEDPGTWFASVAARNDDALVSETVDVGDHDVIVRAWPGDEAWSDFAVAHARDGIPALSELIGLPWPASRDLDIVETAAPYLYGYAGWYQPIESVVEVGDELDAHVMLHELSHLWFNDDLFDDRWISEGLADVFAAQVAADQGAEPSTIAPSLEPVDRSAPGAFQLNDWDTPNIADADAEVREAYGYNTSWFVVDSLADEIGLDGLAEVVRLADARAYAYDGPGLPDALKHRFDWRQLLDLLEERAGSTKAADLFTTYVAGKDDQAALDARAAARTALAELVAAGEGWIPPAQVRDAMSKWMFDDATKAMAAASDALVQRAEAEALLAGVPATTAGFEALYERSTDQADLADAGDAAVTAAHVLADAAQAADRSVGPLGAVGLLFNPPDDRLVAAGESFTEGDFGQAATEAQAVVDAVDDATRVGLIRAAALACLLGAVTLLRRLRRRVGARSALGSQPIGPFDEAIVTEGGDDLGELGGWSRPAPVVHGAHIGVGLHGSDPAEQQG